MKKSTGIILLILGVVIGAAGAVGVYYFTVGEVAWDAYLEEKLIPNATLAISAIGALCVAALPIISRVDAVLSRFKRATDDVNDTVKKGAVTESAISSQNERIAAFESRFDEMEKLFEDGFGELSKRTKDIETISRIGFGNTAELVKKGYAAEIERVGVNEDED